MKTKSIITKGLTARTVTKGFSQLTLFIGTAVKVFDRLVTAVAALAGGENVETVAPISATKAQAATRRKATSASRRSGGTARGRSNAAASRRPGDRTR